MYRYLLFTYPDFYPAGGMEDCIFKANSLDEVKIIVEENRVYISTDNTYIYDIKEDKKIFEVRGL